MDNTNKYFEEMEHLWETFRANHEAERNKAAARRARGAINELKKLITPYKKASIEEN